MAIYRLPRWICLGCAARFVLGTDVGESVSQAEFDILDYIDPLIGTASGGHVFAGATLPFGMAKAVADTVGDNQAGFAYDDALVSGFSHMHDSGTGGAPSLGNFPIFPQMDYSDLKDCKWQLSDRATNWSSDSVKARPGSFSINLANGVSAGMTVTNHSALYKFHFNSAEKGADVVILVDLVDLPNSRAEGTASVDPRTGRLTGNGTFDPSFGIGSYRLHFCIDFKGAAVRDVGTWQGSQPTLNQQSISVGSGGGAGAFVRFQHPDATIYARVGVSFKNVAQACGNAETEQPNFDFEGTVAAAEAAWRRKLNVMSIVPGGVSVDMQKSFWSGLYRAMISPQDYTEENALWQSDEPYYDSYYCIWDSFRGTHQLLTVVDPMSQSRMMRSLVDIYRHEGYLPDCRMSLCKGFTQGGSNADVLFADAYLKRVPDIDWTTAYEAVVKDAEVEPPNWNVEGRGGLASWKNLGYIPKNDIDTLGYGLRTRSVSRTIEYAYEDFCIAELAQAFGHMDDYRKYMGRAANWRNLFKANQTSSLNSVNTNFTGFLQPKLPDGMWDYQDPILCSPVSDPNSCYLNSFGHETYEGSIWLYTFYVPQDMASLINVLGGPETFVARLDYLHDMNLVNIGDEQGFLPVYQYHYAGRPALSSRRAHYYIPSQFNSSRSGLAGNDDSGAMGSFVVWSMMGLFPVPGQNAYLISPPFFKEVSIRNGITGNVATVRNLNFDPSYTNIYIQSVKRDGKLWAKNWIAHDFFLDGGILEIELGSTESAWGMNFEDLPPSMSPYQS